MTCSPQLDTTFLRYLFRVSLALAALAALTALAACDDDDGSLGSAEGDAAVPDDASTPRPDAGGGGNAGSGGNDGGMRDDAGGGLEPDGGLPAGDAGAPPFGGLVPDTDFADHELDLFGKPGHRFWFEVDEAQLARMNLEQSGSFPGPLFDGLGQMLAPDAPLAQALQRDGVFFDGPIIGGVDGDIYTPSDTATWADHLIVEDVDSGRIADYGKVEAKLVGESTGRTWDFLHIPNIRVDANQFEKGKKIGGFEHIRFNNGLVGSIFREALAHRIYRELGYPALRSSWAFIGSNVWGHDIWVPMVLMEVYKKKFCTDNEEVLGGTCENMWEFPGGVGDQVGATIPDSACQVGQCDHSRLEELNDAIAMTAVGDDIKPALEDLLDWDRFHQFQCLSWMMWTGDDPIHGGNNNLIIEREEDGKLIWAPYSIDISAGQDWYTHVSLTGSSALATRCQADAACWADTIETCEELIEKFDELNPEKLVDEALETLGDLGMLRDGDEQRAEQIRQWYDARQDQLPDELERFRYLPDQFGNCPEGLELCGDEACGTPAQCAERKCAIGQDYCDSLGRCVDTKWEPCPTCGDAQPVHCHLDNRCVVDQEACWATCGAVPGNVYCPLFDACVSEVDCASDDDAGVIFEL